MSPDSSVVLAALGGAAVVAALGGVAAWRVLVVARARSREMSRQIAELARRCDELGAQLEASTTSGHALEERVAETGHWLWGLKESLKDVDTRLSERLGDLEGIHAGQRLTHLEGLQLHDRLEQLQHHVRLMLQQIDRRLLHLESSQEIVRASIEVLLAGQDGTLPSGSTAGILRHLVELGDDLELRARAGDEEDGDEREDAGR